MTLTATAVLRKNANSSLDERELAAIERYRRAVNYLAAAQIYLKDNVLLEEPLCREHIKRFDVNGYREEGTTTTPFDMQIRNRTSRWHLVMQAASAIARRTPAVASHAEGVIRLAENKIRTHGGFIHREGHDPDEVATWEWRG